MERVLTVYRYLKTKCDLPELPPIPKPQTPKPEMKPIIRKDSTFNELKPKRKDVMTKRILENKIGDVKKETKRDNENVQTKTKENPKLTAEAAAAVVGVAASAAVTTIHNSKVPINETALNVGGKTNRTTMALTLINSTRGVAVGGPGNNSSYSLNATSSSSSTTTTTITPSTQTTTMITSTTTKDTTSLDLYTVKKTHKVVVFFVDDKGKPRARLEYH